MTAFFSWQHAIRSSKLESTTKLVCYTIWSHMASDGTGCFPSYALIADESGLSRRCVIDHVDKAEKAGFLVIDARQRENGSASSNVYRPTMPGSDPAALGGDPNSLGGSDPAAPPEQPTISNNPSSPSVSPKPKTKASSRALPATTIQQHFGESPICPDEFANDASRNHGFSQNRIDAAFAAFLDHHASKGSRFVDHRAAFRTWCRNEVKFAARGSGQAGGRVRDNAAAAVGAVISSRYGATQPGSGVGGRQATGQAGPDGGGEDAPFF
ncbi:helix-turn-helix domain-containing protein [Rhizobium beringeri]|uniref:helix-turn-helix domain-containing protein n=1 Tax=Rhizobium TaxID=379 RepID=UPI0010300E59|nr:helix-turn-helix domain-containing protein [Rhizobium leguminosarum]TBH23616.1 helix-turn-helix domain-containing protein [Rhizobium leguminosarum]